MPTKRLALLAFAIWLLTSALFSQTTNNSNNFGQPANGSYSGSDIDNVQLNNGNLHIEIPLYSVSGRGLPVAFKYVYDSKGWFGYTLNAGNDTPVLIEPLGYHNTMGPLPFHNMQWNVAGPMSNGYTVGAIPGLGYSLGTAVCFVNGQYQNNQTVTWQYKEPSGASHTFPKLFNTTVCGAQPTMIYAVDGSGFALQVSPTKILFAKDGTQIKQTLDGQGNVIGWVLQDTNGNQISKANTSPAATTITDTLGRSLNSDFVLQSGSTYKMTYYDSSGSLQTITMVKSAVSIQTHLCGLQMSGSNGTCTEYSGSWQLPTEIDLPNNTKYTITYNQNSYGTPASITLPSGATITYAWGAANPSCGLSTYNSFTIDDAGPRLISRTISGPDVTTATWNYTYACKTNGGWPGSGKATVTDPNSNDTVHLFDNLSAWQADVNSQPSYEIETDYYSGSSSTGTLLKIVATDYLTIYTIGMPSKLPIHTTTTWNAQGNLQQRTETDYDSAVLNGMTIYWGDPLETREYGFGVGTYGALARKTHFNYAHLAGNTNYNANYVSLNIANRVTEKQVYDGSGNLVADAKTAYDGNTITAITGVPGHVTAATQYRGNPTQAQVWRNLPSVAWLASNSVYNDLGNLISTTDPGGHATTFSYADSWSSTGCGVGTNTQAFLTETDAPDTVNSQGATVHHRSRTKYYPCTGQKQLSQDENDILASATRGTSYTYDLMLRPKIVERKDSLGAVTSHVQYDYTDTANAVAVTTTTWIDTLGKNRVEVSNHDGLGRVKNTVLQDSVAPYNEGDITTDTTYDLLSRVSCVSNPHRAVTSATDGQTCYQYDALSRRTQETPPDSATGGIVTYTYGAQTGTGLALGLTTTITDQAGKKRMSVNDALGQLADVWEQSDSSGTLGWETAYQYDTLGNLKRVDQKGGDANSANWRTRTFTYDSLSRLLTATNPESGQITWTYDNDSNVLTKLDAKGTTITYNYDQLHRVATTGGTHAKSYLNNPPPNDTAVDYYFDQTLYNGLQIYEGVGKQTGMADATGSSAWSFDSEGRTVTENQTINISGLTSSAITKSITYHYNLDSSLQYMIYPSGRRVDYQYSSIGRTGSVADNGTGGATYLSWNPPGGTCGSDNGKRYSVHGEELCLNHGNGIVSYNAFNKRFQPTLLSAAGASGTVLSLSYTFPDPNPGPTNGKNNGLLFTITNNKDNNRTQNFTYDQLNRLTSGFTTGPAWGANYTPDPWGNTQATQMAGKNGGEVFAHAFNGQNRITDWAADYDANGNLTNDHAFSPHFFMYDAENRPYSGGGVTYYYDGTGERVAKKTGTNAGKLYWFQDDNSPVAESDQAGTLSFEFIFANGKRLARRDSSGTVHYYFSDQINSANVITSDTGSTIQAESDYMPYGAEIVIVPDSTGNQYKFTGKERDTETDLDYFGARYYSHSFMRFMTPDWSAEPVPIPYAKPGLPQTLNLYLYLENNPITGIDPDGHGGDPPSPYIGDPQGYYNCLQSHSADACNKSTKKKESFFGVFFGKGLALLRGNGEPDAVGKEVANTAIGFFNLGNTLACHLSSNCKQPALEPYYEPKDDAERKEMNKLGLALLFYPGGEGSGLAAESRFSKYWMEFEEHHLLPQQFRTTFEAMGIDIDRYTVRMYRWRHKMKELGLHSRGWNKEWETFLSNPRNRTPGRVFNKLQRMIHKYGVGGAPL